jgi:hypothetical protein
MPQSGATEPPYTERQAASPTLRVGTSSCLGDLLGQGGQDQLEELVGGHWFGGGRTHGRQPGYTLAGWRSSAVVEMT